MTILRSVRRYLQVALDVTNIDVAVGISSEVALGGADIIEVGTPLIKSCGMSSIPAIGEAAGPGKKILADMKTIDVGYLETQMAADSGANITTVLASASDSTICEAVRAGSDLGIDIMVDLIGVSDPVSEGRRVEGLGADLLCIHSGIDELGGDSPSFRGLREVAEQVSLPIFIAGGLNFQNVIKAFDDGASVAVVGRSITLSRDPGNQTRMMAEIIHNYGR